MTEPAPSQGDAIATVVFAGGEMQVSSRIISANVPEAWCAIAIVDNGEVRPCDLWETKEFALESLEEDDKWDRSFGYLLIPVVPKSALDAERARADAMKAENKSTADELRRLRELLDPFVKIASLPIECPWCLGVRDHKKSCRLISALAQPERAERSE